MCIAFVSTLRVSFSCNFINACFRPTKSQNKINIRQVPHLGKGLCQIGSWQIFLPNIP